MPWHSHIAQPSGAAQPDSGTDPANLMQGSAAAAGQGTTVSAAANFQAGKGLLTASSSTHVLKDPCIRASYGLAFSLARLPQTVCHSDVGIESTCVTLVLTYW